MSHRILGGLTVTLLASTLVSIPSGEAQPVGVASPTSDQFKATSHTGQALLSDAATQSSRPESSPPAFASQPPSNQAIKPAEALKVGEQAPQATQAAVKDSQAVITRVHSHNLSGQKAATLYVRNIPVLTFIGESTTPAAAVKVGAEATQPENLSGSAEKALTIKQVVPATDTLLDVSVELTQRTLGTVENDPVWRASVLAAKINQLNQEGADATKISVSWQPTAKSKAKQGDRFAIKLDGTVLAIVDGKTILPDATSNRERDALTATNRLRRLLGNAAPLTEVLDKPKLKLQPRRLGSQIAFGSSRSQFGAVRLRMSGMASWYGPGFHGNRSASGEVFRQTAMTAAHRTLPFGTLVRVTNVNNGRSVIVKINDRGPYSGGRVIDLSAGAARLLGITQSGVAPVRLDVLGGRR